MNFTTKLKELRIATDKAEDLRLAYDRAEAKRSVIFKEISGACMPSVMAAVAEYNVCRGLRIDSVEISIGEGTICLGVRLRYPSGSEPDEEFSNDETNRITRDLRPYLERYFSKNGIPLRFVGISVPSEYWSK